MTSFFAASAVFYIVLGWLWLRRAYIGEKALVMVTLAHSRPEREPASTRLFHAFLGLAYFAMGLAWVLPLLWKTRHFHWPKF